MRVVFRFGVVFRYVGVFGKAGCLRKGGDVRTKTLDGAFVAMQQSTKKLDSVSSAFSQTSSGLSPKRRFFLSRGYHDYQVKGDSKFY
ncbi:hypothetical protein Tco_0015523 [Tanacetum coccineum]